MTPFSSNCWPTSTQLLLLEAGLKTPERATKAWIEYCQRVDLQRVEYVSTTFFPLVFSNLKGGDLFGLDVCRSQYRYTWSSNHLLFFKLERVLKKLHEASIETCLLKGAASIFHYYIDRGLRVLGDVDLLVPQNQVKNVLQLLGEWGWKPPKEARLDSVIQTAHAMTLSDPEGYSIDLHWAILTESWMDQRLKNYPYQTMSGVSYSKAKILTPEDHFIHTLFHGVRQNEHPLIRWIPDGVFILRRSSQFKWGYFLSQIEKLQIEATLYFALRYLHQQEFAPIPPEVLTALGRALPHSRSFSYFQFLTQKPGKPFRGLLLYWHSHVRNAPTQNRLLLLLSFPRFIKKVRHFARWHQFFFFLFQRASVHCKRAFSGRG